MRPVNLVPKEYRRGALAGKGGETFSYVLIGALAVLLLGVVAVVLTGNSVSDKKAEIAKLKQQEADEQARADAMAPYANFATLEQTRTATVASLAQSRFDWQRALQELSKVIPPAVSLTGLTGTASPSAALQSSAQVQTRGSIAGPALEVSGCAPGQVDVATFVAAIEDIDGVTRVGLESSGSAGGSTGGSGAAATSTGGGTDCGNQMPFSLVAAFDAAPVPPTGDAGALTLPAPATPSPAPDGGGVGQADQQQASQQRNVQSAKDKTEQATHLIPGN
jgi:type IV pilus assembly protein PilN